MLKDGKPAINLIPPTDRESDLIREKYKLFKTHDSKEICINQKYAEK